MVDSIATCDDKCERHLHAALASSIACPIMGLERFKPVTCVRGACPAELLAGSASCKPYTRVNVTRFEVGSSDSRQQGTVQLVDQVLRLEGNPRGRVQGLQASGQTPPCFVTQQYGHKGRTGQRDCAALRMVHQQAMLVTTTTGSNMQCFSLWGRLLIQAHGCHGPWHKLEN